MLINTVFRSLLVKINGLSLFGARHRCISLSGGPGLMHTVGVFVIYSKHFWNTFISTVALCQTEELSGDNSLNFYWPSLNQPCFWTDGVVCSCFGIKGHANANALIVFYFYYMSLSFRVVRDKYAVEVILYYCIHVGWFALYLLSFFFLSSIKESFSLSFLSLFHLTCVYFTVCLFLK